MPHSGAPVTRSPAPDRVGVFADLPQGPLPEPMARAAAATASTGKVSPWNLAGWVFLWGMALTLLWVAALVAIVGLSYYLTPIEQRFMHPRHELFGAGGLVGVLVGMVGAGLMAVMALYSVHKWIPVLHPVGTSQFWMRFHMICGIVGPIFIVLHSGMKAPSIGTFSGIAFWVMVLVAISGFFGRYLFGYFPASAAGLRVDLEGEQRKLTDLRAQLVAETRDAADEHVGQAVKLARDIHLEPRSLGELFVLDAEIRRRADLVRIMLHRAGLPADVRSRAERTLLTQLTMRRNMAGFEVARRLLRYWNLFHQPLALAMYLMSGLHILNAILFGGVISTLLGG